MEKEDDLRAATLSSMKAKIFSSDKDTEKIKEEERRKKERIDRFKQNVIEKRERSWSRESGEVRQKEDKSPNKTIKKNVNEFLKRNHDSGSEDSSDDYDPGTEIFLKIVNWH